MIRRLWSVANHIHNHVRTMVNCHTYRVDAFSTQSTTICNGVKTV